MKINGLSVATPEPQFFVIPHGGQDLAFRIQGVYSFDEFEKLVPEPKPPRIVRPGGQESVDYSDADYLKAQQARSKNRMVWIYLKGLEPSNLEFEKVKINDPATYQFFDDEFKNVGIALSYLQQLEQAIINLCGFNPEMVQEATQRFLAGMAQPQNTP